MNKTVPLVSILIPVYNREHLVVESIESAINQTYANIEIVIVDNCSTDNTWSILQNYQAKDNRIKIFQNVVNVGPVLNWKRCIDEAKGEYGKILFSDDLISENFIEETMNDFDKNTSLVISSIKIFDKETITDCFPITNKKTFSSNEFVKDLIIYNKNNFPVTPGCAIFRIIDLKNNLLTNIENPFNIDFKILGAGNDLLLLLLSSKSNKYVKINTNAVSFLRFHEGSFTVANKLGEFYDFSKYFFVKHYEVELFSRLKSNLWLKGLKNEKRNRVYDLIENRINIPFLFVLILIRLKALMVNLKKK